MTKIQYIKPKNFRKDTVLLLEKIVKVVDDYQKQGYRMTLRQLFYQLVTKNILENKESQYKKLSTLLKDARMSGLIDWDVIEDRIRVPSMPNQFDDLSDLVQTAISAYRLDRWENQEYYVEVWVEKEALYGILEPITRKYHVHLLINRRYSSTSALHESVLRIKKQQDYKECVVLYMGDHDPSGMNMVQDIRDRFLDFGCHATVEPLALTMDQIEKYNLPSNPAKMSDPRSKEYVKEFGRISWELDALDPDVLSELISSNIEKRLYVDEYQKVIDREDEEKLELVRVSEAI